MNKKQIENLIARMSKNAYGISDHNRLFEEAKNALQAILEEGIQSEIEEFKEALK